MFLEEVDSWVWIDVKGGHLEVMGRGLDVKGDWIKMLLVHVLSYMSKGNSYVSPPYFIESPWCMENCLSQSPSTVISCTL